MPHTRYNCYVSSPSQTDPPRLRCPKFSQRSRFAFHSRHNPIGYICRASAAWRCGGRCVNPAVIIAEKTQSGTLLDNAIAENVRSQVARLKNSPSVVAQRYAGKKIDIVGAVYDLRTGKIALV